MAFWLKAAKTPLHRSSGAVPEWSPKAATSDHKTLTTNSETIFSKQIEK